MHLLLLLLRMIRAAQEGGRCRTFSFGSLFLDVPAGVTQEEGHTGFPHIRSAVLALVFLARRIQAFSFPRRPKSNFVYQRINRSPLNGHFYLFFLCV